MCPIRCRLVSGGFCGFARTDGNERAAGGGIGGLRHRCADGGAGGGAGGDPDGACAARTPGVARVVAPTCNEHAACLRAFGWQVEEVAGLAGLPGADVGIVVNPNNPYGRQWSREALLALVGKVGLLVVDESFAGPMPGESLAADAGREGLLVLRSFGKFYGLAGLRLGFALGSEADVARLRELAGGCEGSLKKRRAADVARLRELAGPWPVAGPAIGVGTMALANRDWARLTTVRLIAEAARLGAICVKFGWQALGGTPLFRLYDTPDAQAAQGFLARSAIWSRIFPYSNGWLRLGLPGGEAEWARMFA